MAGYAWTPDEITRMERFRGQTVTPALVREVYGDTRSYHAVVNKLDAQGVPFRRCGSKSAAAITRIVVFIVVFPGVGSSEPAWEDRPTLWEYRRGSCQYC